MRLCRWSLASSWSNAARWRRAWGQAYSVGVLGHLFPEVPAQPGYFKRRRRLAETIEWLMGIFASQSPGLRMTAAH